MAKMNKATRIALVTGEMRDCMSPVDQRREQTTRELHGGSKRGRMPRPRHRRRRQRPGGHRRLAPIRCRECRGLPRSAPPLRRSSGRGGSPAGGTGRRARTARRGGAPGHGHRGPAAASSPSCGGGGGPGAGKLRHGSGPWGTGVKCPVALQVSDESHPRGRESCGRDAAGAAAPGPEGSVQGQWEPPAAQAARPRQTGTAPAGVFRPAEVFPPRRSPPPPSSSSAAAASCGPPAFRRAGACRACHCAGVRADGVFFPRATPPPALGTSTILTAHRRPTRSRGRRREGRD
ncbi:bcl-2-binding component 3, isoforms 3/4-like [Pithys albifrons albifrons]|uniref:bcl-2-binding component 3, isoforms 3/4-like n=1 Tax=Pithys albifrons albifrons TaxID=3385563 RepID=UPI003A5D0027